MSLDFTRILGFGSGGGMARDDSPPPVEHVMVQRPLRRVLAFTGRTIDQVVNCPIAKREVLGYYKLYRWVERRSEVLELERQWNKLGGG